MLIKVLSSSADQSQRQFSASYLINNTVAIDAGSIGLVSLDVQKQIRHVFISHSHLDHIASLPFFIDNVYEPGPECPIVYGSEEVIHCLKENFFNEHVWPDVLRLSQEESSFLKFVVLEENQSLDIEGLKVTPISLNHVVSTFGFLIEDQSSAVALVSDTAPTKAIWKLANECNHLKAVFLESAFPNSMAWLAEKAMHLTPELFLTEYRKLGKDVPVVAIHIKPAFHDQVISELKALELASLIISKPNHEYEF